MAGNGTVSTNEAFLQGATSYTSQNAAPGKAIDGNIKVTSTHRHIEDGTQVDAVNDPLADLYWKAGIDTVPPLDKYVTTEHIHTFVWVVDKQATTEETGLKHEECTDCGYTQNENTLIDKLPKDNGGTENNNNGNTNNSGSGNTGNTGNNENTGSTGSSGTSGNVSAVVVANTGTQVSEQNDWQKVNSRVLSSNTAGENIVANVKADDVIPAYVLESLKGKDTTLTLTMPNGVSWNIYGKNITADTFKDINLGVVLNSNVVPAALKSGVSAGKDYMEISLNYDGEFGFQTTITIPAGKQHEGMYAKVYYYNAEKGSMDYITSGKVDANGNVNITLAHASDYVLVFDSVGTVQTGDQTPYVMILIVFFAGLACIAAAMKKRTR